METIFLDDIQIESKVDDLFKLLKVDMNYDFASEIVELFEKGKKIGRPKALYGIAYINNKGENWVDIEGIRFTSRLLSINLKDVHRVFPYIVTCGMELNIWAKSINDPIEHYWADTFCEMVLRSAFKKMTEDFKSRLNPGKTATMNPGSLDDWPISDQRKLFYLMGDKVKDLGVELTDSFLMVPIKSMSGLMFSTETTYENCMLCPRERCPGRRSKYDPEAFKWDK
ncbi:MAG TPA: vitamin B12 dependent methionine synthase [Gallicola sp.]|nr:vitamin B12 dependent methionine synthase [Gallicola sp.]